RLVLEPFQLRLIRAMGALQFQVLSDCVVEDAHARLRTAGCQRLCGYPVACEAVGRTSRRPVAVAGNQSSLRAQDDGQPALHRSLRVFLGDADRAEAALVRLPAQGRVQQQAPRLPGLELELHLGLSPAQLPPRRVLALPREPDLQLLLGGPGGTAPHRGAQLAKRLDVADLRCPDPCWPRLRVGVENYEREALAHQLRDGDDEDV